MKMVREKPDENEKTIKEYNVRGERMYKNLINRENAKTEKINKNKMKKAKANIDAFRTEADAIKKYILIKSMKKIDDILKKTVKIRKMNTEFYGRMEAAPFPKTNAEQERTAKKINDFQRGIGKRWGEIWLEKEEIFATIATLYELSETRRKYPNLKEPEIASWEDIRREIQEKMKKITCE